MRANSRHAQHRSKKAKGILKGQRKDDRKMISMDVETEV
jgi:formylmethanofuran dehydrogenase subunit B